MYLSMDEDRISIDDSFRSILVKKLN